MCSCRSIGEAEVSAGVFLASTVGRTRAGESELADERAFEICRGDGRKRATERYL